MLMETSSLLFHSYPGIKIQPRLTKIKHFVMYFEIMAYYVFYVLQPLYILFTVPGTLLPGTRYQVLFMEQQIRPGTNRVNEEYFSIQYIRTCGIEKYALYRHQEEHVRSLWLGLLPRAKGKIPVRRGFYQQVDD